MGRCRMTEEEWMTEVGVLVGVQALSEDSGQNDPSAAQPL